MVSAAGLTLLLFIARHVEMDHAMEDVEIPLLIFFISLFIVVGGVEHSGFLRYLGQFIIPFVQEDLLTATLVLLWVAAILSAAIDNIPFTAAMIPILLGMEASGIISHHYGGRLLPVSAWVVTAPISAQPPMFISSRFLKDWRNARMIHRWR